VARALILTYHAVEAGRSPLSFDARLFAAHADEIVASGLRSFTIRQLAEALHAGDTDNAVAITFDDGFASVVETAVPLLLDRGLTATVFCVAGHLGGMNDWPSARSGGLRSPLASAHSLADPVRAGIEIGSHGVDHAPLQDTNEQVVRREAVDSKAMLEDALGTTVSSFSYPYGVLPTHPARGLVEQTYSAACTTALARVSRGADPLALPRVDAHYVRRPEFLHRVLEGRLDSYLRVRDALGRARRTIAKDYANPGEGAENRESLTE